ncbi:MAG: virulence factor BrkB family protein [Xanthomonadales bacterium]|nr:virulence factor BrkB family protein [Xanthomonadales bacterium]
MPARLRQRLHAILSDRERTVAFFSFTWERFLEDRCLQTAGALAYTTLFALVPLTAAVLGVLAAFPVFADWRGDLTNWVFQNFVPAAGSAVQGYITEFADSASKATAIGVLVLLFSAVSLMMSIEDAFNRIWRVQVTRSATSRFVIYWTALTLGPLLLVAALAISSYAFALPFIDAAEAQFSIKARMLAIAPFLITWAALVAAYVVIPNRAVRIAHALAGALIAAVLFEAAKRGFAFYATSFASYQRIYGALALVPIFILWIYLSWIIVLLGASITASLSAFDYRPPSARLARGHEFSGLLCVIGQLVTAQRAGRGRSSDDLLAALPFLTDDLLQRYLGDLHRVGVVQRSELGEWLVVRDLARVSLREIYDEGRYRLALDAPPPRLGLRPGVQDLVGRLGQEVCEALDVSLAELFPADVPSPADPGVEPALPT